jgi:hypothetical protein
MIRGANVNAVFVQSSGWLVAMHPASRHAQSQEGGGLRLACHPVRAWEHIGTASQIRMPQLALGKEMHAKSQDLDYCSNIVSANRARYCVFVGDAHGGGGKRGSG